MSSRSRIKSWPGWLLLAVVVVAAIAIGVARSSGPRTTDERVDALAQQLACPICNGETVYESQNKASEDIRNEVTRLVRQGAMSDDQILATIERSFPGSLLVPRSDGVDALIWGLPAALAVLCAAGLFVVFRRWRRQVSAEPDDQDRALVAQALRNLEHDDDQTRPTLADERNAHQRGKPAWRRNAHEPVREQDAIETVPADDVSTNVEP